MKIEDEIQLANTPEVAVKNLNIVVNYLKDLQLIILRINAHAEIQTGIPFVYNFETSPFNEIAELWTSGENHSTNFTDYLGTLLL